MREHTILCAILCAYAVYVDLCAAALISRGDTWQSGPMAVWGVIMSVVAVAEAVIVFRGHIRKEIKRLKTRMKK